MEAKRRANKAFARAKQLWIWTAALAFSYVDLVTTVVVGLQYLSLETARGTHSAHVTFIPLGTSLGIQTLATHLTGMQLLPLHRFACAHLCRYYSCKYLPPLGTALLPIYHHPRARGPCQSRHDIWCKAAVGYLPPRHWETHPWKCES